MKFELPELPYLYGALEPHIDALTVQIHYEKHHRTYLDNLNKALLEIKQKKINIEELLKSLDRLPESHRSQIQNNGGGFYNHNIYWSVMTDKYEKPSSEFVGVLESYYASFENFKVQFGDCALKRFGSGWVWLVLNNNKLEIVSTANQDNPISIGKKPILGLDVWEHAYYLKYQNRRSDYINNFWNIVNWSQVETNYNNAKKN